MSSRFAANSVTGGGRTAGSVPGGPHRQESAVRRTRWPALELLQHVPHRAPRRHPRRALASARATSPAPSPPVAPGRWSSWPARTVSGSSRCWSGSRSSDRRCPTRRDGRRPRGRRGRRGRAGGAVPRHVARQHGARHLAGRRRVARSPARSPGRCWGRPSRRSSSLGVGCAAQRRPRPAAPRATSSGALPAPGRSRGRGFGAWYVLLDLAARGGDPLWALVFSRAGSALIAAAVVAARRLRPVGVPVRDRRRRRPVRRRRQRACTSSRARRCTSGWRRRCRPLPDRHDAPRALRARRAAAAARAGSESALAVLGIVLISLGG